MLWARPPQGFETRSFPTSLGATRRGFAFYLADPAARLCQTPTPRTMKGTSPAQMLIHLLSRLEHGRIFMRQRCGLFVVLYEFPVWVYLKCRLFTVRFNEDLVVPPAIGIVFP